MKPYQTTICLLIGRLSYASSWCLIIVADSISQDYIAVNEREKYKQYLPHTAGRYNKKRFRKALCPIVERLSNSLMMHGRNNGKKMMAVSNAILLLLNIYHRYYIHWAFRTKIVVVRRSNQILIFRFSSVG
jgi:hypothetical protein